MKVVKYALLGLVGVIGLLISMFGPFKIPFAETLARTYYRYAIAGVVAVLVVLGGAVASVVMLLDPNQFKAQIVNWVQERTQRELRLEGQLKLTYFPKLGLEAGKASLSQRRSAREFAAVDGARVTIAWLPLFRRQVQIDRIEIDGLRANVVRFKDGSTNVDDLLRDAATVAPASIDIDVVRLGRSTLHWNDEQTWQRGSLNDLQVELGRLTDGQASPLNASVRIDAPGAGVDARLQVKGRVLFDAKAGRVELAGLAAQLEGRAFGFDNLALGLHADLAGHPRDRQASAENVVVTSASKSGLSVFNARLVAPQIKFGDGRLGATQLSVDASVAHPDQTVTAALQWPELEWSGSAIRGAAASAQVSLHGSGTHLRAQLSSPLVLRLDDGPRFELDALEASATIGHPALAAELAASAGGKLEIDLKQRSARLSLAGKLAGADMRGDVVLADFGRPAWTVDVEVASLDLDRMLSHTWLARWGDDATPFDVSFLRDLTLTGTLRAHELKLGGVQLAAFNAQFDAQRSALAVAPITAQAYGAALDASLSVSATAAPRISGKGTFTELDLRALRADLPRLPWLDGRADIAWDLQSEGGSAGSLRGALSGPVTLAVRTGSLAGIDLRSALLDGRSDAGSRPAVRQREFNPAEATPFGEMKARIELGEGRARGQAIELHAAPINALGNGDLAFRAGQLDLRLRATVARAAHEFSALACASVPVHVHGPWREPRFAIDFGAASGAPCPGDGTVESPVALSNRAASAELPQALPPAAQR
jgi:AsmA protein